VRTSDAVEKLLEQASPRRAPPAADEERIREVLRAEWQAVTGRRVSRRRVIGFAVAASVVLAATLVFNSFRLNDVAPLQVATIDKSHGSIYLLGEQSELRELIDLSEISAGQTLITGSDSGIGLMWGSGGSLRVDADTRIEFVSENVVYLRKGQVYFDSQPGVVAAISTGSLLQIQTDYGAVTHMGTQYMTYADDKKLAVSVREGTIAVDGLYYDATAAAGEQLTLAGRGRPSVVNIKGYGDAWQWVEATTQDFDVDGRTMQEFLDWVSRETGLQVEFSDAAVMEQARQAVLRGIVDKAPTEALRLRMMTASLDWRIEGGNLIVTAIDSSSGR
jgi:ferric-dicitrate binding protein FerR (iron transport regulator)